MAWVLPLSAVTAQNLPQVGGKGANLGELLRAGFRVPPGFCVTAEVYRRFVAQSAEADRLIRALDQTPAADTETLRRVATELRKHLQGLPLRQEVDAEIREAYRALAAPGGVAVRSSATAEDLPDASFAGQQETYLNVRGEDALVTAVRGCFASLFTDRAVVYRAAHGLDHASVALAVVVQQMVVPDVSGILFTADPVSGRRGTVVIDASFGLGEALVSGRVTPDQYRVREGRVERRIMRKTAMVVADDAGGSRLQEVPPDQQTAPVLTDAQAQALAEVGRAIERRFGVPQDIEWCMAQGELFILQSRPITTLHPIPPSPAEGLRVFVSLGHQQMMTDALTPMGMSVLRTVFPFAKGGAFERESPVVVEAASHLFVDPTDLLQVWPFRRVLPRLLEQLDERIAWDVQAVMRRPEFRRRSSPDVRHFLARFIPQAIRAVRRASRDQDVARAWAQVNAFADGRVRQTAETLARLRGAVRVRAIQADVGRVIPDIVRHVGPYMFLGVASSVATRILVQRWTGRADLVAALNRSLPGNITSRMGMELGDLADLARPHPRLHHLLASAGERYTPATVATEPAAGPGAGGCVLVLAGGVGAPAGWRGRDGRGARGGAAHGAAAQSRVRA
ncbi:MAG: hypothetical protein IRZ10_09770 [Thermoflavifilum sp.]|nr:hypothetical protein [Thermoflavifilum sp.]MCL6514695.1 hypothetical protein [Alicyclobacillus sp.]